MVPDPEAASFVYPRCDVPEGRSGEWVVERFLVPQPTPDCAAGDVRPQWARTPPGSYTRLRCDHETFMTDLRDEWYTQREAIEEARRRGGQILVTGLGLGLVVDAMLAPPSLAPSIDRITVVEYAADVIRLVAPSVQERHGDRVEILQGDAFTFEPPAGVRYSVIWHDIWPNPHDPAVAPEMQRLCERFADCCDWQGCWTHNPRLYG